MSRGFIGFPVLMLALIASPLMARGGEKAIEDPTRKTVGGKSYKLVWSDEFNGTQLDMQKWRHRVGTGYGFDKSLRTTTDAYLDNQGNLVMAMRALTKPEVEAVATTKEEKEALAKLPQDAWIHAVSDLTTHRMFVFGYHEVRFKLPRVPGPGLAFWFPYIGGEATEIDVIEQTLYSGGNLCDYKASTIHWYPGGNQERHNYLSYDFIRPSASKATAERLAHQTNPDRGNAPYSPKVAGIRDASTGGMIRKTFSVIDDHFHWDDEQFHTVAVLWTPKEYSFCYDGQKVCTFDVGISKVPQPAIISISCRDALDVLGRSPERNDSRQTPAKVLVDYYRVYEPAQP